MVTDWIMVALTVVIAVFTFLVWKVYERIAWLTGAMESHSDLILKIEALRGINNKPIEVVWWDPTIEPTPGTKEHGQPMELNRIYVFLPPHLRRNKPSKWKRACGLFGCSKT